MILITYIARVRDGLALAASIQDDEKVSDTVGMLIQQVLI